MEFGAITRHEVYDRNWFPFEKRKLCNAPFFLLLQELFRKCFMLLRFFFRN